MNIKELIDQLDKELVEKTDKYIKLHDEFNTYRGVVLDDEKLERVNQLLLDIQTAFQDLYPAFYFIAHRYESVKNFSDGFEKFIDEIKKAGAQDIKGRA